ncbi:MAG: DUF4105 domain-containing protein [Pseudomonadota bacterium]
MGVAPGLHAVRSAVLLLLLLLGAVPGTGSAAGRFDVSLVTIGPGEIYWARFGHNAILVEDRETDNAWTYNYGLFDLAEEDFFINFARGRMRYLLAATDPELEFEAYRREGRSVLLQRLALTDAQALELVRFLEWNRLPGNRSYLYDYFRDNCSTRVRDALDDALGGALAAQFKPLPASEGTFRWHTRRLAAPEPWLYVATDLGLGPFVDKPVSRWDEFFLPRVFADAVREVSVPGSDGSLRPLVTAEQTLAPARVIEPAGPPGWSRWYLLAGVAGGIALFLLDGRTRSFARRSWWLLSGLIGAGLLCLWLLTDHAAAWANANALLFTPLTLPLVLLSRDSRWASPLVALTLASAAAGAVMALVRYQGNLDWVLFAVPLQAAAIAAWVGGRRARKAPTPR